MCCGGPISWCTVKQSRIKTADIATSTTEAEYYALVSTCKEASWYYQLCNQIHFRKDLPISVYCDNKSTIALATKENFSKLTCHINLHKHFVERNVKRKIIKVLYIPSLKMLADGLTKALGKLKFKQFVKNINLCKS